MKEHILKFLKEHEEKNIQIDRRDDCLIFILPNSYYRTAFDVEPSKEFKVNHELYFIIQSDDDLKKFCHVLFYRRFQLLFDCFFSSQNVGILLNKFTHSKRIG